MAGEEFETITAAEYGLWIPPRVALQRLGSVNRDNAISALLARLGAGTVLAAARTLRRVPPLVRSDGFVDDEHHYTVLRGHTLATAALDEAFWATGDLTIISDRLGVKSFSRLTIGEVEFALYVVGVRFNPAHLAEMEAQLGIVRTRPVAEVVADILMNIPSSATSQPRAALPFISPPPTALPEPRVVVRRARRRPSKAPVSHAEFMTWHGELSEAERARGYRVIWAAANKHFRPRKVPKAWCEELSRGRKLGRKPMG